MTTAFETRQIEEPVELRASHDGGSPVAFGYAARFDKLSSYLGGFVEIVTRSAFSKTMVEADVRGLFNHNPDMILGRNKAGTMRLGSDVRGLWYEIDLPDTTVGRDVAESMRRGDVTGSSFAFRTITDEWSETDQGMPLRSLTEVELRDVSPVTYPAYPDAESAIRSLADSRHLDVHALLDAYRNDSLAKALTAGDTKDDEPISENSRPGPTHRGPSHRSLAVS